MKRMILVVAISTLFTGCAQVGQTVQRRLTPSIEVAKQDCVAMGFSVGTPQYQNCVLVTTQNIRNSREQSAQASEAARLSATPRMVQCRQIGSMVQCQEF